MVASAPALALVKDGQVVQPVTTYSVVARDPDTGQLGVAVQSHWFSVGTSVPWVQAGVGAVATQSLVDVSYGPLGLELMRAGKSADDALRGLLASDATPQWRQVGMIDASGNVAVHTGKKCIREAGHVSGENFVVMANLMENATVWQAMADAFRSTQGDLTEKLLSALEAAELEGGDIRGRQSAAIVVVTGEPTGVPYRDTIVDLRVEDDPAPVRELRRLVSINRAYKFMNEGDERLAAQDTEGAVEAYTEAMRLAPNITEIKFWSAITLFAQGEEATALEYFSDVFKRDPVWIELVRRLPQADLLPNDDGQVERILSVAEDQE
jgi:uncharacterized Ntn-hydrolase superfamily protein